MRNDRPQIAPVLALLAVLVALTSGQASATTRSSVPLLCVSTNSLTVSQRSIVNHLEERDFAEPTFQGCKTEGNARYPVYQVRTINGELANLTIRPASPGEWEVRLTETGTVVTSALHLGFVAQGAAIDLRRMSDGSNPVTYAGTIERERLRSQYTALSRYVLDTSTGISTQIPSR